MVSSLMFWIKFPIWSKRRITENGDRIKLINLQISLQLMESIRKWLYKPKVSVFLVSSNINNNLMFTPHNNLQLKSVSFISTKTHIAKIGRIIVISRSRLAEVSLSTFVVTFFLVLFYLLGVFIVRIVVSQVMVE